jgi:MYXO-CTERM domain-containing protein|nr:DUF2330 domain-containing protein [Kofleriaceae bacterium]
MSRRALAPLVVSCLAVATAPRSADAFCGFYVASGDTALFNDATQVVLMRDGTRTVLAMQNDYKGPPEGFAMVVPVPVVLHDGDVKTLPRDVFDHVDKMGAPRLVEYWEQDPCASDERDDDMPRRRAPGAAATLAHGVGGGGYGVTVEAQFVVGEYEVVVLSATESTGLDAYLRANRYTIPAGAEPLLRPYVEAGMKFFVARVDPTKVKFENGHAALSPLRFHYDSDDFTLPIRLGLANSEGTQDLIVSILAPHQRYEVANYKNAFVPTNLDVTDAVRDHFAAFYASLFDDTSRKNPGAVVTEYAWQATTCDPCPGPTLRPDELMLLGGDVLAGSGSNAVADITPREAIITQGTPTGDLGALTTEDISRVLRARTGLYRACFQKELQQTPALAGKLVAKLEVAGDGSITSATASGLGNGNVESCVARNMQRLKFPAKGSAAKVSYPIEFALGKPLGASYRRYPDLDLVLTRLHVRYGKDITNDLTFRKAEPVFGGRESDDGSAGQLAQGATASSINNFQARYTIRHAWTGPVACASPRRGRWGGPPGGGVRAPIAAQQTAFAPRGQVTLANALASHRGSAATPSTATPPPSSSPAQPEPPPTSPPSSPSTAPPSAPATTPPSSGGCGCETTDPTGWLGLAAIAGAFALARRRRRAG